jgi:uncharacterized protein YyaL (SSP411 family)
MRKLVVLMSMALMLFAFEWAGKVNWALSYNLAKQIAKKEHKLVMVDIALSHCPPCKYLAQNVYTRDDVANYINKNFVPVFYLADQDNIPAEVQNYFTGSTPTILFIKPNGELFYSFIGARPPQTFLQILKDVNQRYKGQK